MYSCRLIMLGAVFVLGLLNSLAMAAPLSNQETGQLRELHPRLFYLHTKSMDVNLAEQLRRAYNMIAMGRDYPMAIAVLNQVLALDADNSEAYLLRGIAYTRMDELWQAEKDYKQALLLEPENPTYYYYRGENFRLIKDRTQDGSRATVYLNEIRKICPAMTVKGKEMFEKALQIEPYYLDAIVGLGDCYFDMGLYRKALDEYNRVLVLAPEHGVVLEKKRMAQQALAEEQQQKQKEERRREIEQRIGL